MAEHHCQLVSATVCDTAFLVGLRPPGAAGATTANSGRAPATADAGECAVAASSWALVAASMEGASQASGSGGSSPAHSTVSKIQVGTWPEGRAPVPAVGFAPLAAASSTSCRPP